MNKAHRSNYIVTRKLGFPTTSESCIPDGTSTDMRAAWYARSLTAADLSPPSFWPKLHTHPRGDRRLASPPRAVRPAS